MNREILFRAWDKEKKRMSKPIPIYFPFIEWNDGDIEMPTDFALGKIDRFIFMQQTGLPDKNGTPIYEGDIVSFHKGYVDDTWTDMEQGRPYQIVWDQKGVRFFARRKTYFITPLLGTNNDEKYPWKWEVIGNIYQNPELLNKQQ